MGSTRAEGRAVGAVPQEEADLVAAAAALRWVRPDLTAALADHVLEEASAAGRQDRWLLAAGWVVHARAATGDARRLACELLAGLDRWGAEALATPAAHRLRVELATVAAGAGEVEHARRLLAPVDAEGADPELAADLLCAHARCGVEEDSGEVGAALDAADAAWAAVGGRSGQLGGASVALVRAVVERRAGRPAAAIEHAAEGLARLERGRSGTGTPSAHLAAALAAEWISALLDADRSGEASDACAALLPGLSEQAPPSRQLALLRLTVARTVAAQDASADTAQLLAQAADDAARSDVPDLEAVCRTALGALQEQAGQLEVALETLQLAVAAERRDRDRSRRFAAALAAVPPEPARPQRPRAERYREEPVVGTAGDSETTALLPAITRSDRKLRSSRQEQHAPAAEDGDTPTGWGAVPWNGSGGDSPIGDLLIRSLRRGPDGPDGEAGTGRRNGTAVHADPPPEDDTSSPAPAARDAQTAGGAGRRRSTERTDVPSGWLPGFGGDRGDERPARGRRRARDTDAGPARGEGRTGRRSADRTPAPGSSAAAGQGRHGAGTTGDEADEAARTERLGVAEQPATGRRSRRAADEERADRNGTENSTDRNGTGPSGASTASAGRDRGNRRADDPWATGLWSVARDAQGRDGEGAGRTSEPTLLDSAALDPAALGAPGLDATGLEPLAPEPSTSAATPTAADPGGSDGWLQAALAELDRALMGIGVNGPAADERVPDGVGCSVVVDIARDGRRFAGPRAAAVVRAVADLVVDRLPPGARTRFGDADALVISRPGWSRSDATGWMHATLPGLFDGFVTAEDVPGAQLRAAVHDTSGPLGAQILQPLAPARHEHDRAADPAAGKSEARGQEYRAAARTGRQGTEGGRAGALGRDRRHEAGEAVAPAGRHDESPRWPYGGQEDEAESAVGEQAGSGRAEQQSGSEEVAAPDGGVTAARVGRHEAGGRRAAPGARGADERRGRRRADEAAEPSRPAQTPAGEAPAEPRAPGRRSRRAADAGEGKPAASGVDASGDTAAPAPPGGSEKPERPESTEGLGIADLLAGALAAYRGI